MQSLIVTTEDAFAGFNDWLNKNSEEKEELRETFGKDEFAALVANEEEKDRQIEAQLKY